MASEWTDELKAKVVKMYEDSNPTAENSMDIVKSIAEELDKTANGVRMILSKAGVYVKSTPKAVDKGTGKSAEDKPKRTSKADAISALGDAIINAGMTPDLEIISKLTGKAALYFAEVIKNIPTGDDVA
jgi:hypothetical protein